MSSFGSLYTVRSGLMGARRAMDLVGQNVANANTVGYSRQEASFVAAQPTHVINSAGKGVAQVNALRYRDDFLDRQYRLRSGSMGYHEARSQALFQVEQVLGGLDEGGLRTALEGFFNAWDTLSLNPSHATARLGVVTSAEQFLGLAKATYGQLTQLRGDLDEAMQHKVAEVNNAAYQIAELNQKIMTGVMSGQAPNDLMDRRDMLVDSLSRLTGATAVRHDDGQITVHIGSMALVSKSIVNEINVTMGADSFGPAQVAQLTWKGTGTPEMNVAFPAGELAALKEMRDTTVPGYIQYLDKLVRTVATEVNTLHNQGVPAADQIDIFVINADWLSIHVNPAVASDPTRIIAAATWPPAPGDGGRALQMAGLRDKAMLQGDPVGSREVTPAEYLRSIVTHAGLEAQASFRRADNAAMQTTQAENLRQTVMGVSLDDEMTKMVQFQQSYNAAARVMTSLDEMLDVIVNRIGVVGR